METALKKIANYSGLSHEARELKLQALKNSVLSNTLNVRYLKVRNKWFKYKDKYPKYTFLSDDELLYKEHLYIEPLYLYDGYVPEEHIKVILDAHIYEEDCREDLPKFSNRYYNPDILFFIYDREETDITIFHYVKGGILVITFWNLKK